MTRTVEGVAVKVMPVMSVSSTCSSTGSSDVSKSQVTAYYWHNVGDESIHMAVADPGWAKAGWGKLYGQWICGATLFVYDFDRFIAADCSKCWKSTA